MNIESPQRICNAIHSQFRRIAINRWMHINGEECLPHLLISLRQRKALGSRQFLFPVEVRGAYLAWGAALATAFLLDLWWDARQR